MSDNPLAFDELVTDELTLRPPRLEDIPLVASAFADPAVGGEAGMPPFTEQELVEFARDRLPEMRASGFLIPYLIWDGDDVAGGISYQRVDTERGRVELGYWLLERGRGRGVASRAVRALADRAFTAGVTRVEAVVRPQNEASIRVLERVGFQREGLLRSLLRFQGERSDAYLYSLLPGE
jgi:ribosomal-protein-alanine N-acetyltransferase